MQYMAHAILCIVGVLLFSFALPHFDTSVWWEWLVGLLMSVLAFAVLDLAYWVGGYRKVM